MTLPLDGRVRGIPVVRFATDVLIVGGGAAGTMAAFECADAGVSSIQVTKGRATSGTTTVARGGFEFELAYSVFGCFIQSETCPPGYLYFSNLAVRSKDSYGFYCGADVCSISSFGVFGLHAI